MTALFIFIHTVICILLVIAILMQSGKGGGLTEGFASAESMLGAQTNTFMTKLTGVLVALFVGTSLTLAFLSSKKDASLMEKANYTAPIAEQTMDDMVKDAQDSAVEGVDEINKAVSNVETDLMLDTINEVDVDSENVTDSVVSETQE